MSFRRLWTFITKGTPRDPFDEPTSFLQSLAQYTATVNPSMGRSTLSKAPVMTASLIAPINAAFDRARQADSYKIHRVVLNRLEGGREAFDIQPTLDLGKFAKFIAEAPKEALPPSVRQLWTGHGGSKRPRRRTMDEGTAVRMDEPDMATLLKQQDDDGAEPPDPSNAVVRPGRMKRCVCLPEFTVGQPKPSPKLRHVQSQQEPETRSGQREHGSDGVANVQGLCTFAASRLGNFRVCLYSSSYLLCACKHVEPTSITGRKSLAAARRPHSVSGRSDVR